MAEESNNIEDYSTLSPEKLHKLLHRLVHITLFEGEELQGWVYTIDPVSFTIVIADDNDSNGAKSDSRSRSMVFVMSKAVKGLRIAETTRKELEWVQNFTAKKQHGFTDDELQKRKEDVLEWLKKNRVPIVADSVETKVVKVLGGLTIEPPYDVDSCKGTNGIVLERIRNLINSMPGC